MSDSNDNEFELVDSRKSSSSESFDKLPEKSEDGSQGSSDEKTDTEVQEKLPFVDQSIKDEAERKPEKTGEEIIQERLNAPLPKDQEQFYTPEDSRRAITLLILFSAMMFTLPLLVMFTLYYWVFIDHYHLPPDKAMLYSGICAAGVVIAICAAFAYIAWKEEKDAETKLKAQKETKKTK